MRRWVSAVLLVCAFALCPLYAQARDKAQIVNYSGYRSGENWAVNFYVEGAFTEKMENAILSGIPTTFTYNFTLHRQVSGWMDEKLFAWKIKRTIHFDNLKREFEVVLDNEGNKVVVSDFLEAKKAMVTFENTPVVVAGALSKDHKYYLRVKAALDTINLPVVLNELLFFVSLWDFETPWTRIDLVETEEKN